MNYLAKKALWMTFWKVGIGVAGGALIAGSLLAAWKFAALVAGSPILMLGVFCLIAGAGIEWWFTYQKLRREAR